MRILLVSGEMGEVVTRCEHSFLSFFGSWRVGNAGKGRVMEREGGEEMVMLGREEGGSEFVVGTTKGLGRRMGR